MAVEIAKEFKPNIIIMDIKMPLMSGIEAARIIREQLPMCKITLLSGFTYFNYAKEAISIGISDFIVKPALDERVISVVQDMIKKLNKEHSITIKERESSEKIKQVMGYLERELVSSIAFKQIEGDYIEECFLTFGIKFSYGVGVIASLNCKIIETSLDKNFIIKKCMDAIRKQFKDNNIFMYFIHNNIYILRLYDTEVSISFLENELKNIYNCISIDMKKYIKIVAGSIIKDISNIYCSFNEARIVLHKKGNILLYKKRNESHNDCGYPLEKEDSLCENILTGDIELALANTEQIFDWINENCKEYSLFKARVYDLLVVLNRCVAKKINVDDTSKYAAELEEIYDFHEMKDYVINQIEIAIGKIVTIDRTEHKVWKDKILEYMNMNYMDNITLDEVAKIAGFSSYYLSKIFKNEFKVNYSQYLTNIRIQKAKELLRKGELSVKQISYMIGYSEPNYFARVFKKETGLSASEYQKKVFVKQNNAT
jgi:two-component system response regulator YesN